MLNIYLIGMMGSGKSVTGKSLATLLHYRFLDLDSEIEKKSGKSIGEIFEQGGEEAFRHMEANMLMQVSEQDGVVIATGGGIILREPNVEYIKAMGKVIYLEAHHE